MLFLFAPAQIQDQSFTQPEFIPGEIFVKFQRYISTAGLLSSTRIMDGLCPLSILPRIQLIRLQVKPGKERAIIEDLLARGDVEHAEPNYIIHALEAPPGDPWYSTQWALPKIKVSGAWAASAKGSGVIIAVIDTSVDLDHPDLSCPSKIVGGWAPYNNDAVPDDDKGHGSHVAGIAAACANNGQGGSGVVQGARLIPDSDRR